MHYNYVIVGAGSAGAIMAARLSEDPSITVLLLESGPLHKKVEDLPGNLRYGYGTSDRDENFWYSDTADGKMFVADATPYQPPMLVPRGTTFGGSSSVNAQIFLRGEPDDYDSWAKNWTTLWDYENCLPFFKKLENDLDFGGDFHGKNGPIQCRRIPRMEWAPDQEAFFQATRSIGYPETRDHNDPDSTGVGPLPFNTIDRVRQSTWLTYLLPIIHRSNLTLRQKSKAIRLNIHEKTISSLSIETDGKCDQVFGDQFILSAGAIGSPQLMMLSGLGPAGILESIGINPVIDIPGVGQNLRDHPQVALTWNVHPSYKFNTEARGIQVAIRYTASQSPLRNDMLIHPVSFSRSKCSGGQIYTDDLEADLCVGMVASIYLAKGRGAMKLRSSDPGVQPYLDYNYLDNQTDLDRLREAAKLCIDISKTSVYKNIISSPHNPSGFDTDNDVEMNLWIQKNVRTSHHISGTCKMGPQSDNMSVVDESGKVYGLSNIRVIDASIMPDCVRANTNVPTMMIAERIYDLIKDTY